MLNSMRHGLYKFFLKWFSQFMRVCYVSSTKVWAFRHCYLNNLCIWFMSRNSGIHDATYLRTSKRWRLLPSTSKFYGENCSNFRPWHYLLNPSAVFIWQVFILHILPVFINVITFCIWLPNSIIHCKMVGDISCLFLTKDGIRLDIPKIIWHILSPKSDLKITGIFLSLWNKA